MGIFTNKDGGYMDVIRCDEPSYLIWKWYPTGSEARNNTRENTIRWGSSLRVKDGSVAVFVYKQNNSTQQDYVEGPYDQIIKTSNFPVLANIIGLAYAGDSPFQAEVYFINLAKIIQISFAVPYFDLYDPRFLDFGVPTAVRGTITFNIADYREFIKLHRLTDFDLNIFQKQIKDAVARYVKGVVANIPLEKNMPVVQIEREIPRINEIVEDSIRERFQKDFGVNITGVDIETIDVDKTSEGYKKLKSVTQDVAAITVQTQTEVNLKNLQDMQRINAENTAETLRVQREEAQYAQHKQSQGANFAAYQLEQQAAVGIAGANALGQMGTNGATEISGSGGMNPAGMMTGIAMGGAVGQNMAGMMNGMMGGLQQNNNGTTPPPVITSAYHIAMNGQTIGPYDIATLLQMASVGTFTKNSLVWKQGMGNWVQAETVQELQSVFGSVPPVVPVGMPPMPPTL